MSRHHQRTRPHVAPGNLPVVALSRDIERYYVQIHRSKAIFNSCGMGSLPMIWSEAISAFLLTCTPFTRAKQCQSAPQFAPAQNKPTRSNLPAHHGAPQRTKIYHSAPRQPVFEKTNPPATLAAPPQLARPPSIDAPASSSCPHTASLSSPPAKQPSSDAFGPAVGGALESIASIINSGSSRLPCPLGAVEFSRSGTPERSSGLFDFAAAQPSAITTPGFLSARAGFLLGLTDSAQKFGRCLVDSPISFSQRSTPCTGETAMAYMLERPRTRRPFNRTDILSQLGETIFLPEAKNLEPINPREQSRPTVCDNASYDEDPERWDGMS
jgi:hypothetical protein